MGLLVGEDQARIKVFSYCSKCKCACCKMMLKPGGGRLGQEEMESGGVGSQVGLCWSAGRFWRASARLSQPVGAWAASEEEDGTQLLGLAI